ncbi:MAG: Stomatin-like protein 2, mitochondrial [Cirrosporium novae-zelandiae]|nr:MAG: Stomatin-like protein 2, mitochondrial [Cirrosporium novae-zelandiae]
MEVVRATQVLKPASGNGRLLPVPLKRAAIQLSYTQQRNLTNRQPYAQSRVSGNSSAPQSYFQRPGTVPGRFPPSAPTSYFSQRASLPANTIIRFVPQQTAWIVERMGKFNRILEPGLAILIPIIDRIAYVKSLKENAIEIPSQSAITLDNVTLELDGVLYTRVFDAYKASYGVEDAEYAISQLAQTTMRSEIGQLTLDHVLKERAALNTNITQAINEAAKEWGVICLRYEIRDIHAPEGVVAAMHRQVTAERSKRAEILESEGQRQSAINIAEGRKQSVILASEALQSEQVNIASGEAEAILLKAKATARGIEAVAGAIQEGKESAQGAVSLSVAEKYVDAFSKLAKEGTAVVVPGDVGNIGGMIATALSVYGKVSDSQAKTMAARALDAPREGGSISESEEKVLEKARDIEEKAAALKSDAQNRTDAVQQSVLEGFEETRRKR